MWVVIKRKPKNHKNRNRISTQRFMFEIDMLSVSLNVTSNIFICVVHASLRDEDLLKYRHHGDYGPGSNFKREKV